jgi:hypothetical protein
VPSDAAARLAGIPVVVVGSKHTLEERVAMTRVANQKLLDDDRRTAVKVAIPIAVVAMGGAVYAVLAQSGCLH